MNTAAAVFKAVKGQLVAGVDALGLVAYDGQPVQVTWGDPGGSLEREHIWFDGMRPEDQNWTAIGNLQRGTEFELDLRIVVHKKGGSAREADERAFDLLDAIETYLRDDPEIGLNIAGVLALIVDLGGWQLVPVFSDQAREAWVDARVRIKARI